MKRNSIVLILIILLLTSCNINETNNRLEVKDWDLLSIGYSSDWCSLVSSRDNFRIGIIEVEGNVLCDDKSKVIKHSELINSVLQKIAPTCKTHTVMLDTSASEQEINDAIKELVEEGFFVISLSFGRSEKISFSDYIMHKIQSDSLVIVCAAGNEKKGILYPAASEGAISVLARDINGGIAKVDLHEGYKKSFSAPGTHVWINGSYYSGSSIAAVYVSVAFAAVKSKYPEKKLDELIDYVSQRTTNSVSINDYGTIQYNKLLK